MIVQNPEAKCEGKDCLCLELINDKAMRRDQEMPRPESVPVKKSTSVLHLFIEHPILDYPSCPPPL